MNWDRAISRNRDALAALVAVMLTMLGVKAGADSVAQLRIARALHTAVFRLLRPAEAAVRRLIVVAARGLVAKDFVARPFSAGRISAIQNKEISRKPRFALEDNQVPMILSEPAGEARGGPRIRTAFPVDPTVAALIAARVAMQAVREARDGLVPSAPLLYRLEAMRLALDTLPQQALRLMRWKARRERLSKLRLVYTSPLRPGLPPWLNRKRGNDADHVLERCHWLAYEALRLKPVNDSS